MPKLPGINHLNAVRAFMIALPRCRREAIILHLESLREHGEPIPQPQTTAALIEVQPF